MKRIIAMILVVVLALGIFAGCAKKDEDFAYIEKKGNMIVGITLFAPMNYEDENGDLVPVPWTNEEN